MSGFWDNVTNFFFKNEDDENTVEEDTLQLEEPGKAKFDVSLKSVPNSILLLKRSLKNPI